MKAKSNVLSKSKVLLGLLIIPNYSREAKKINIPSKKDKLFQDHQQNAFSISSTLKKGQKVPRVKIK